MINDNGDNNDDNGDKDADDNDLKDSMSVGNIFFLRSPQSLTAPVLIVSNPERSSNKNTTRRNIIVIVSIFKIASPRPQISLYLA